MTKPDKRFRAECSFCAYRSRWTSYHKALRKLSEHIGWPGFRGGHPTCKKGHGGHVKADYTRR